MELNLLNLPIFQELVKVFAESVEDERIPEDVRKEYSARYEAIMHNAVPSDDDFEQEYDETSERIKEHRESMVARSRNLIRR